MKRHEHDLCTSAGRLLIHRGIMRPTVSVSVLIWFISYIRYWIHSSYTMFKLFGWFAPKTFKIIWICNRSTLITGWRLFQKFSVRTKFDIYVFLTDMKIILDTSPLLFFTSVISPYRFIFYIGLAISYQSHDYIPGADPGGGGAHPARAPPKIGRNMIFWLKIVIFHTKYPKNVRASLRSAQFV